MFTRKGVIVVEKSAAPDVERLLELALEAGAEDLNDSESSWEIVTDPAATHGRPRRAPCGRHRDRLLREITMLPQYDDPGRTAARPGRCSS